MKKYIINIIVIAYLIMNGCSSQSYRFAMRNAKETYDDQKPIPVPASSDFEKTFYMLDVLMRRPAVKAFDVSKNVPSKDVNFLDDLSLSSWFTPRLGYINIPAKDLLIGPQLIGPPQKPITVKKS